jgi:hypothetical protein
MKSAAPAFGVLLIAWFTACARDRVPATTEQPAIVPVPRYADGWQTLRSERWGLELRLPPDVAYVTGGLSAICDDTLYDQVSEPAGLTPADDAVSLAIYFTHKLFGNGEPDGFGWRRPTEWNPDAEPGWEVYGEGPSSAALLEGNGWFGLGGEPLVKIFFTADECLDMMAADADSTARDSIRAEAEKEGGLSCGSAHDTRPRYMAVVRRPSDGCYVWISRSDGVPVGDVAETVRFIDNGKLVAPVGMQPARAFSFRTDAGVAARTGEWTGCIILRNPWVPPGTPITMISLALQDEAPKFSFVGEPEPKGCGPAPAGHNDGSDTTRWYAYRIGSGDVPNEPYHAYNGMDVPMIALIGHQMTVEQLDSMRITRDSIRLRDPNDPRATRLLMDVDRDGVAEAFAEDVRGDSTYFTITRGSAAGSPVVWRASFPRSPTARVLPSPVTALTGRVERNQYGEVCLTITNPRIPFLTPVEITAAGAAKAVQAHVAWRPPGGCSRSQRPGERGYGLMLADTGALAVGAVATGTLRD